MPRIRIYVLIELVYQSSIPILATHDLDELATARSTLSDSINLIIS
jgi:hypothetical protein